MILYTFIDENAGYREMHDSAQMLLSQGLKMLYGISDFRLEKGEHGKPYLPDHPEIYFNLSHCKGLAACGISQNNIGVDAELIRSCRPAAMKKIFSPEEQEFVISSKDPDSDFFRIWTLKEALGKYMGTGLFSGLSGYSFSLDDEFPICQKAADKIFTQKILHEKWVISVCAHDPENDLVLI